MGDDFAKLIGEVTLVEPIGSEAIVHVGVDHGRFLIKTPRGEAPSLTDRVGLNFHNEAAHAFEPEGRRM